MSRNLLNKRCDRCDGIVLCLEDARALRPEEGGVYYEGFKDLLFANADCVVCGAQYLAWMHLDKYHHDLSYRSTFNDEPGEKDLPEWSGNIEMPSTRTYREDGAWLTAGGGCSAEGYTPRASYVSWYDELSFARWKDRNE